MAAYLPATRMAAGVLVALCLPVHASGSSTPAPQDCDKPVYLTFDTGHMGVADLVADVLRRHQVRVTFFAANETTQQGDGSLGTHWAPWWKARAQEGHRFASHTWDHTYWRGDLGTAADRSFRVRPSQGAHKDQTVTLSAAQYCAEIRKSSEWLRQTTGQAPLPLWRAPGGKTSPQLLQAAEACGFKHVGWSPAGFLGDELSSEKFSNAALLQQALARIRPGDVLLAHLGIWSRKDPWAPAVLEPLITGLQAKGFCFRTLDQHPDYRAWVQGHTAAAATARQP
ncbi:polysaccharide deacetylase family protein [Comamonas sp. CMM03]|uniref:polysaccharide deacetylase family protein n=1 Tax=Comamonas sp. CMM03 TaxID=2854781 RepID=UPI002107E81C|nr:polysaccharide deacetylase family protein [Comamonas sp. CMM03]